MEASSRRKESTYLATRPSVQGVLIDCRRSNIIESGMGGGWSKVSDKLRR